MKQAAEADDNDQHADPEPCSGNPGQYGGKNISQEGLKIRVQQDLIFHSMPGRVKQRNDGAENKQEHQKKARISYGILRNQRLMIDVGKTKTPEGNNPLNKE